MFPVPGNKRGGGAYSRSVRYLALHGKFQRTEGDKEAFCCDKVIPQAVRGGVFNNRPVGAGISR